MHRYSASDRLFRDRVYLRTKILEIVHPFLPLSASLRLCGANASNAPKAAPAIAVVPDYLDIFCFDLLPPVFEIVF
jgi:hypothetical protein